MEKRIYLQPKTKVLTLAVSRDLCDDELFSSEELYGPPTIFEETPMF